jgi:hypothetical protein
VSVVTYGLGRSSHKANVPAFGFGRGLIVPIFAPPRIVIAVRELLTTIGADPAIVAVGAGPIDAERVAELYAMRMRLVEPEGDADRKPKRSRTIGASRG